MELKVDMIFKMIHDVFKEEVPDITKNLDALLNISIILISNYIDSLYEIDTNPPFGNETKMEKETYIKLTEDYYKIHGFKLDLHDLDIEFKKRDYDKISELRDGETLGLTYEKDGKLHITLPDYGLLLDSTVLIHEYSHSKNVLGNTTSANRILTEAIAFSEELLYVDYLEELGYSEDATRYKKESLRNFFSIALNNFTYTKVLALYNHYPNFSNEYYEEYYGPSDKEEKEEETKDLVDFLTNYQIGIQQLLESLNYTLACIISAYMYETYKEDKTIFNKLQNLHTLSRENTLEECLQEIGLDLFSEETLIKLESSFKLLLQEVKEKIITINKNNINKEHNLI